MDITESVCQLIQEAMAPLEARIDELEKRLAESKNAPKEVRGVGGIVRWCHIPRKEVTLLANSGALGKCIWKHQTEKQKGCVMCLDIETASRRYREYANRGEEEKFLWRQLGVQKAELEWQALGL